MPMNKCLILLLHPVGQLLPFHKIIKNHPSKTHQALSPIGVFVNATAYVLCKSLCITHKTRPPRIWKVVRHVCLAEISATDYLKAENCFIFKIQEFDGEKQHNVFRNFL